MNCQRVSKKKSSISRTRARKIISDVRTVLKDKYKFSDRLVGSAARNTIVTTGNEFYDLDYQLILTKKSKKELDANTVRNTFYSAFDNVRNNSEHIENSTTSITILSQEHKYSIDFVIIKLYPESNLINRRNNKKENITVNDFNWNQLPNVNDAYFKFKNMIAIEKQDVCDNYIIPRKCIEKSKAKEARISSMRIFIEEINNYGGK